MANIRPACLLYHLAQCNSLARESLTKQLAWLQTFILVSNVLTWDCCEVGT